ncbi:MAG TPA: hypothetical protein VG603_10695 [Chitinophagales bacterium]|nr:hypothetical protein [Chitinophagales bacterium]
MEQLPEQTIEKRMLDKATADYAEILRKIFADAGITLAIDVYGAPAAVIEKLHAAGCAAETTTGNIKLSTGSCTLHLFNKAAALPF